jgi:hypothetical protein
MNEFERRWTQGAAAARRATPAESTDAPLGFATRVVAQWQSQPAPSLLSLWQWHASRVLKVVLVLMFVALAINTVAEITETSPPPFGPPAVEDTVADSVSIL